MAELVKVIVVVPVNRRVVRQGKICTSQHAQILLQPVTDDEIKSIVFHIPKDKAPGPDGYNSQFFKDAWNIVGEDVITAVHDFFNSGQLLKQINTTNVTLIPKVKRPTSVHQFRPIACCNVIYKCISKILCNRLSKILPEIISENQSGFIKGRSIMENIMICQDIIKLYERQSVSPRCLFKLDLQKAYDSVEWGFLRQILKAMQFPRQFRGWIMQCVSTASYTLNLNGHHFGFFLGQRGLRQGDPLSPLLFTICMEYLSRLLQVTTQENEFRYHPLCKQLKLTHLMFADDLLLFCKGDVTSIMVLLRTFTNFSKSTGLRMSMGKSNAYFNGVQHNIKSEILQISGMVEGTLPFKYLGIPIKCSRLTKHDCQPLLERIMNRIRGISHRKLSYAGRLTLVKSVLKSLHIYWASMFILPNGVITKIESLCRNFLWDGGTEYQRTPMVAWEKICMPKSEGGLGLKQELIWNRAAIGKLVWWIHKKSDHLWVKWVNTIYIKTKAWFDYTPPPSSSWYWRKICQVKTQLQCFYQQEEWSLIPGKEYTIGKGYEQLRLHGQQLQWTKYVWNCWTLPKHSIMAWIMYHQGFITNVKLKNWGVKEEDTCYLCGQDSESYNHLFFRCIYSNRILIELGRITQIHIPLNDDLNWRQTRNGSKVQKEIANALVNATIYQTWRQRNKCKHEQVLIHPAIIANQIVSDMRIQARNKKDEIREDDRGWLRRANLM